jgi:hypothetical protein
MREVAPAIKVMARDLFQEYLPIAQLVQKSGQPPDERIEENYLHRWWLAKDVRDHDDVRKGPLPDHTRRVRGFSLYLHCLLASDKPLLHDHKAPNASLLLSGRILEHTPIGQHQLQPGAMRYRRAEELHRLELQEGPAWTLFLIGLPVRQWGFQLADGSWAPWTAVCSAGPDGVRRFTGLPA